MRGILSRTGIVLLLAAACGGTTGRHPAGNGPEPSGGTASGSTSADGGRYAGGGVTSEAGVAGEAPSTNGGMASGSGGVDAPAGAGAEPQSGNANGSGGAAGSEGGQQALGGAGGDASGNPGAVTIDAQGLVYVTYTPATPDTVVSITIDPNCGNWLSTIESAESICATITRSGDVIGLSRVCFAQPFDVYKTIAHCQSNVPCSPEAFGEPRQYQTLCCDRFLDTALPEPEPCIAVADFGEVAYGEGTDLDGDLAVDLFDNCLSVKNFSQVDNDHDGLGNACDNCAYVPNRDQADTDEDDVGDACDPDFGAGGIGGAGVAP